MLTATRHIPAPAVKPESIADTITLDHEARNRRRIACTSDGGLAFLLDLAKPAQLKAGDALVLDDGRLVAVKAAAQELLAVTAYAPSRLMKVIWHIGNRHTPAEITDDVVYIQYDHVLAEMVRGLGGTSERVLRAFQPEQGAYAGGHQHSHDHAHAHDGGHDHGPHHAHAHDHDHDAACGCGHDHNHEHAHAHGPDHGHSHAPKR
jgi:urease accessory protein